MYLSQDPRTPATPAAYPRPRSCQTDASIRRAGPPGDSPGRARGAGTGAVSDSGPSTASSHAPPADDPADGRAVIDKGRASPDIPAHAGPSERAVVIHKGRAPPAGGTEGQGRGGERSRRPRPAPNCSSPPDHSPHGPVALERTRRRAPEVDMEWPPGRPASRPPAPQAPDYPRHP